MRVLVVEDNVDFASWLKDALQEWAEVTVAHTGDEGLKQLQSSTHFDLAVFDLYLPGISGLTLLRQTRKLPPEKAPGVLMISGEDQDKVRPFKDQGRQLGVLDFLTKPISLPAVEKNLFWAGLLASRRGVSIPEALVMFHRLKWNGDLLLHSKMGKIRIRLKMGIQDLSDEKNTLVKHIP